MRAVGILSGGAHQALFPSRVLGVLLPAGGGCSWLAGGGCSAWTRAPKGTVGSTSIRGQRRAEVAGRPQEPEGWPERPDPTSAVA